MSQARDPHFALAAWEGYDPGEATILRNAALGGPHAETESGHIDAHREQPVTRVRAAPPGTGGVAEEACRRPRRLRSSPRTARGALEADGRPARAPCPQDPVTPPHGVHLRFVGGAALAAFSFLAGSAPATAAQTAATARDTAYQVYAVRYGTLAGFPVNGLVAGADSTRSMDIAMMVWLLKGPGRVVLVDAGFYRQKFLDQWKPAAFTRASEALAPLGIAPGDVTDVIVTHVHWDHVDGLDLFPNARVWIQRAEYEYYVGDDGRARHRAIDPDDAKMLAALKAAGRVTLVEGDGREILPGITAYTGGRHTYASQYLGVRTAAGTVVVASDNCYLYENLERHAPIAQALDAASNLAALDRMARIASDPRLIVPGHDPAVFDRFPTPGNGIAKIE
jgi:glyoxylase-like metal-dependent hydrolase (beta-lactamase superfamily II)